MQLSVTLIIVVVTCIISFLAFNNQALMDKLIFYPPAILHNKEYYRFFSCGLIHKDIPHLIFNMYALYLFGGGQRRQEGVENLFNIYFSGSGKLLYIGLYVLALGVCLLPTFSRHKNDSNYLSLGASGAVSAVIFAFIFLNPVRGVGLIFIPVFIPGFLFGAIYLLVSWMLDRRGGGNINHSAHIWGALFGIAYVIVAARLFSDFPVLQNFIDEVKNVDLGHIFSTN